MFKLIKWTVIGSAGLGAIGLFLFGDHAGSYLSTMASSIRDSIRGQIPVEFQLKRAEKLIRDIEPQIRTCQREVAQADVSLERVTDEVSDLEGKVTRGKQKLEAGMSRLDGDGESQYRLVSAFPRRRIELDLERTFETYKVNEGLLRSKKALIEQQTRAVTVARQKLDTVRSEKARLEDMIATLKAQKAQLDVMAAGSRRFDLDDSALSKAKQVLSQVKNELDVTQKMLEQDMVYGGSSEEAAHPARNIIGEIHAYFSDGAGTAKDATGTAKDASCQTTPVRAAR